MQEVPVSPLPSHWRTEKTAAFGEYLIRWDGLMIMRNVMIPKFGPNIRIPRALMPLGGMSYRVQLLQSTNDAGAIQEVDTAYPLPSWATGLLRENF